MHCKLRKFPHEFCRSLQIQLVHKVIVNIDNGDLSGIFSKYVIDPVLYTPY